MFAIPHPMVSPLPSVCPEIFPIAFPSAQCSPLFPPIIGGHSHSHCGPRGLPFPSPGPRGFFHPISHFEGAVFVISPHGLSPHPLHAQGSLPLPLRSPGASVPFPPAQGSLPSHIPLWGGCVCHPPPRISPLTPCMPRGLSHCLPQCSVFLSSPPPLLGVPPITTSAPRVSPTASHCSSPIAFTTTRGSFPLPPHLQNPPLSPQGSLPPPSHPHDILLLPPQPRRSFPFTPHL